MKTPFLILILCMTVSLGYAQTRLIAHKSHSGNTASFYHNLKKGSIASLGFGEPFHEWLVIDSVIYVSDTVSVVKSRFHTTYDHTSTSRVDTISHEPVTSKDSIVKIIQYEPLSPYAPTEYDSAKYVGYDQLTNKPVVPPAKARKKKHEVLPMVSMPEKSSDFSPWLWLSAIAMVSVLAGLLAWKAHQFRSLLNQPNPAHS